MRLLILATFAAAAVAADPIETVGKQRYVGAPIGASAVAAGDGYLPVSLTQRADPRGHLRILRLDARTQDEARLDGDALGIARFGDTIAWAVVRDDRVTFRGLRYEGSRTRATRYGHVDVGAWGASELLAFALEREGPVVVFKHGKALEIVHLAGGRKTVAATVAAGARCTAAAYQNGVVYAMGARTGLLRLERRGASYVSRAVPWAGGNLAPTAMALSGRTVAIGGVRGRNAVLAFVGRATPLDLGPGTVRAVAFLPDGRVAVAGSRDGRAHVAVVSPGRRMRVSAQTYLPGDEALTLAVNPSRYGWSLLAGVDDNTVYVLRLRGDRALPGNWNPFARPDPDPEPEPEPEPAVELPPVVVPEPKPVDPPAAVPAPRRARGGTAIFPHVEAGADRDTEIVLLYLGAARGTISVRLIDDRGRVVHVQRIAMQRGQRVKLSVAALLQRRRIAKFDGYAWIDGAARADLVAEASHARGRRRGESVRPHWR